MKKSVVPKVLISLLAIQAARGQITVSFNAPFSSGVSEGFADSLGSTENGLVYGLLIDTASDGFATEFGSGLTLTQGDLLTLATASGPSDDSLFISAGVSDTFLTSNTDGFSEGDFVTTGGDGGLIGVTAPNSVAGLPFAILWFDRNQAVNTTVAEETQFGLLEDASFVLPGEGNTETFADIFLGVDPVRSANSGTFTLVPEPSALVMTLLSGVCFLGRRVRK